MPNFSADGAAQSPVTMKVERRGIQSEPFTRRFPQVRAGTCEFCGVIDPYQPAQFQYKLCPHYRGQDLWCTYCDPSKNPEEVVGKSILNVAESPTNPGEMIVWCDSYECSKAHNTRFKRAGA